MFRGSLDKEDKARFRGTSILLASNPSSMAMVKDTGESFCLVFQDKALNTCCQILGLLITCSLKARLLCKGILKEQSL